MNFNKKIVLASLASVPFLVNVANAESNEGVVTAYALNVRSGPDKSYNIEFYLKKGDKVTVKSLSNGFYKIVNQNGKEGWASSKYIKLQESSVTSVKYTTGYLNMRTGPSTSYRIITTLPKGAEVQVISESNGWAKVKYNSKEGYVSSKYLGSNQNQTTQTSIKYVNTTALNVRSGPSKSYKILTTYKYGQAVKVISISGDWAKIQYNTGYAYISNKYLADKLQSDDVEVPDDTVVPNNPVLPDNPVVPDNGGAPNYGGGISSGNVTFENVSYSFSEMVDYEYELALKGLNKIRGNLSSNNTGSTAYVNATREDLEKYLNPDTFDSNSNGKLQFLSLDRYREGITADELNAYFNRYCQPHSVFLNKGQAFIDAAKKHNIDVSYLVAASMLETGYGVSELAQGVYVTGEDGQKVKVYNFFGIAAFDGTAVLSASKYAYKQGWTTVEKTLDGSAKWISDNYIHNTKYNQNTLYKMRWIYKVGHQYATDITWCKVVGTLMNRIITSYNPNVNLEYLVPKYK